MTLSELGATLRTEREQRGLSLDDVAQRLRISIHVLQSLEDGDVNALPHKAYARGFIRSYATFLGLAADEVEDCVASLTGAPPSVPQPIASMDEDDGPTVPVGKMLACAAVLLVLAGGGYAAWQFNLLSLLSGMGDGTRTAQPLLPETREAEKPDQPAVTAQNKQDKGQEKKQDKGKQEKAKQDKVKPDAKPESTPAVMAEKPAQKLEQAPAPGNTQTARQSAQEQAAQGQPAQSQPGSRKQAQAEPAAPAQPHSKIIVTAVEDCWIQSNADSTNARQFTLRKGDTFALSFVSSLEVKLGNAAGVRIRYNGNELPQAGGPGEARTLHFPPKNQ